MSVFENSANFALRIRLQPIDYNTFKGRESMKFWQIYFPVSNRTYLLLLHIFYLYVTFFFEISKILAKYIMRYFCSKILCVNLLDCMFTAVTLLSRCACPQKFQRRNGASKYSYRCEPRVTCMQTYIYIHVCVHSHKLQRAHLKCSSCCFSYCQYSRYIRFEIAVSIPCTLVSTQ